METKKENYDFVAINKVTWKQKMEAYKKHKSSFVLLLLVVFSAVVTIAVLGFLVGYILINGIPNISIELFSWNYTSENSSMLPAIINTLIITGIALLISVPLGIFSAIYLTEYAKRGNKIVELVRITAETLSGIPSIVYGLFGMLFFVTALDCGYTVFSGALTLSIMVLPTIMRTTEEALLSVPDSYREGSFGLGAGRLRTVFRIVLPSAVPGILSGVILAVGRIVGETAALIYTAGTVADVATDIFTSSGRTLAVHMYSLSREGLHMDAAYATAVVLLLIVIMINGVSSLVAKRIGKSS